MNIYRKNADFYDRIKLQSDDEHSSYTINVLLVVAAVNAPSYVYNV